MNKRKTIEDLTIQDNFMFAAVMMTDTENCRKVIEYALGINVDRVEVVPEKTIIYHPEYKGIRLDVYAKEVAGDKVPSRHFNLEMQIGNKKIFKRSRYYHSQIDMEILGKGYRNPTGFILWVKIAKSGNLLYTCGMGAWKSKNRHKYLLQYHIIFICKYRKKSLALKQISDDIKQFSYPNYLRKHFWKEHTFWTDGYFACSVGNVSEGMLKKYIENQGLRKRVTVDVKGI